MVVEDDDNHDGIEAYNNSIEDNNNEDEEVFSNCNDDDKEWEDREEDGAKQLKHKYCGGDEDNYVDNNNK